MLPGNKNWVREEMAKGRKVTAAWLLAASNITAEAIAEAGFDVAVVDMEHAPGNELSLVGQIQALKGHPTVPFVRVPWNDPVVIKRVLDAGVYGLFVPFINNRAEAERAVAAAQYPNAGGMRGVAGSHRATHYGLNKDYLAAANGEISIFLQIETREGLENLDEILEVNRVDGIVVGPLDLASNLGHFADPAAPEVREAIGVIEAKTLAAGKLLATVAPDWTDAAAKYRRGYSMVLAMSDTSTLVQVGKGQVDAFRSEFL